MNAPINGADERELFEAWAIAQGHATRNRHGDLLAWSEVNAPGMRAAWEARASMSVVQVRSSIEIDFKQANDLLEMFGGEPTEIALMSGPGHSGEGLYAVYTADPEGSVYLGVANEDAAPAPTAGAAQVPERRCEHGCNGCDDCTDYESDEAPAGAAQVPSLSDAQIDVAIEAWFAEPPYDGSSFESRMRRAIDAALSQPSQQGPK